MALADFASGIQGALTQQLARRIQEQELARRAQMEQAQMEMRQQQMEQQAEEFRQTQQLNQEQLGLSRDRLGLERDELGLRQEQANLPTAQESRPVTLGQGQTLVDPASGRIIAQMPAAEPAPQRPMSVAPGGSLVDPSSGRIIASMPDRPKEASSGPRKKVEYLDDTGQPVVEYLTDEELAGRKLRTQGQNTGAVNRQRALDEVTLLEQQIQDILTFGENTGWKGVGGLMQGTVGRLGKQVLGVGSDDSELLRNKIGGLRSDIAHEKFGSAFTGSEKAMLNTFAPTIDRDPSAIKANLQNLLQEAQRKKRQMMTGAPIGPGGAAQPQGQPQGDGGMVPMRAPVRQGETQGRRLMVPAAKVAELEALGATRE